MRKRIYILVSILWSCFSLTAKAGDDFIPSKILVNQVGYDVMNSKTAVLQTGSTSVSSDSFYLLRTNGYVVYKGKGLYNGPIPGWTGRYYWTFDFTSFDQKGDFYIKLKDTEIKSPVFRVDDHLLGNVTIPAVLSFFHHMRDTSVVAYTTPIYGSKKTANVYGGWHDATGDIGKHMSHLSYANYFNPQQTPMVVWSLLESYRLNSTMRKSLLDSIRSEATWGADYLYRSVDSSGALYISVFDDFETASTEREICEWGQAPACIVCRSKNYQAALREGAGMAIAALARSCSLTLKGQYDANQYLTVAEKMYRHLKSPGKNHKTRNLDYCNNHEENIIDVYCGLIAATELYKVTHGSSYQSDAQNYVDRLLQMQQADGALSSDLSGKRPFYHAVDEGLPVLALVNFTETNSHKRNEIKQFIQKWVSYYSRITEEVVNPFLYPRMKRINRNSFFMPQTNETGYWWQGENARIASMAAAFIAANRFNAGSILETKTAIASFDWILGKNPYDVCMMTGVGSISYPTYLNGAKLENYRGGICNGITAREGDEEDIQWMPFDPSGNEHWKNWRWIEQWLPHDAWFLLAISYYNNSTIK